MDASAASSAVQLLLDEQAALRRVATLVAGASDPRQIFATVTEEVGRLLGLSS
jgi:GAF domain-containing protein